jgi:ADP-ribose pyrophosphatase
MQDPLADAPAPADVSAPEVIAKAFRTLERYQVELPTHDGQHVTWTRDMLRSGRVVAVLAVDPLHDELVLIRQFRLGAHLAIGRGDMIETVAGYVDPGEDPADAARRECLEEIGVAPDTLQELFTFLSSPGQSDECCTLYLATIDATRVPARSGAAHELEHIEPIRVPIDTALAGLGRNTLHHAYLLLALQWLALNRDKLRR